MENEILKTIDDGRPILERELSKPLVTRNDQHSINILREQVALAESFGINIATWKRKLSQYTDASASQTLTKLRQDEMYTKLTAPEKKTVLDGELSQLEAYVNYLTDLQDIIKRRCSLGQTFLNSINKENESKGVRI